MNISTRGRYGLRALLEIADHSPKEPLNIRTISQRQKMSVTYLEQILYRLKKAGLVKSIRGAKGGYVLSRDRGTITVAEVIDALDGPISISNCDVPQLREKSCPGPKTCISRVLWKRLEDYIEEILSKITLADLKEDKIKNLERKLGG
jgi:Rrf2 family cysteine metabolism transcriptional repressor